MHTHTKKRQKISLEPNVLKQGHDERLIQSQRRDSRRRQWFQKRAATATGV